MTGKLLLSSLATAVALMLWGFLFWTVISMRFNVLHPPPNDQAVAQVLHDNIPATGTYYYPMPMHDAAANNDASAEEAWMKKAKSGPVFMLSYRADGADPMDGMTYLWGFIQFAVSAMLVGGLMLMALPQLTSYGRRVRFVFLAGLFGAFFIDTSQPIWFQMPWDFHLFNGAFHVVGWLIGGAVMAAILKPRAPKYSPVELTQPAAAAVGN
jgi:hypothetical protein